MQPLSRKVNKIVLEFVKFCLVGIANTILGYCIFILLLTLGVNYLVAGGCGFLAGAVLSFFLNRAWTFSVNISFDASWRQFILAQAISLASHSVAQFIALHAGVSAELTQLAGIAVSTFVNFTLIRNFVFVSKPQWV